MYSHRTAERFDEQRNLVASIMTQARLARTRSFISPDNEREQTIRVMDVMNSRLSASSTSSMSTCIEQKASLHEINKRKCLC